MNTTLAPEIMNITWEQFLKDYKPAKLNPKSHNDGMIAYMYETYGWQKKFVMQQEPANVFTLIEDENGWYGIVSGIHKINRLGYLITEIPCPEDVVIQIQLED